MNLVSAVPLFIGNIGGWSFFRVLLSRNLSKFLHCGTQNSMDTYRYNEFIFSPRYRVLRHVSFWLIDITIWAIFWTLAHLTIWRNLFHMLIWLPVFVLYSYPLAYWVVPKVLLKGKYLSFLAIVLLWGVAGWFINIYYRMFVFIPIQEAMHFDNVSVPAGWPGSYLCMSTATGTVVVIAIFKQWIIKQREWMQSQKEKITAEIQLLKAQVHPHFLFNTLNNIYSFSLEGSPKTPGLILKLSSLLSYMLYDCKADEVLLEKEVGIMKDYTDLEKERYGNKIEISWSVEGDMKDKYIAPLLMLPFLENAFKHGTSEQLEKPWLSVDISVRQNILKCKIANSKNEFVPLSQNGIGVNNVKKRLGFLYPDKHELKMSDEGNFFVVSLLINLKGNKTQDDIVKLFVPVTENVSI